MLLYDILWLSRDSKMKILQKKQRNFDKPLDKSVKTWYNKYITNESSERKG